MAFLNHKSTSRANGGITRHATAIAGTCNVGDKIHIYILATIPVNNIKQLVFVAIVKGVTATIGLGNNGAAVPSNAIGGLPCGVALCKQNCISASTPLGV